MPRENLRRAVLFLGVFGGASGGLVLGHWQGHFAAMVPRPGSGRVGQLELSPDGSQLTLLCAAHYEALVGGKASAVEVRIFDTNTWEELHHGVGELKAQARAWWTYGYPRTGKQFRYWVSAQGVVTRLASVGVEEEFCRLPELDGAVYQAIYRDRTGDLVYVRITHDDDATSGIYVDAHTGEVIHSLPRGWSHFRWGNRPDWIATANQRSLGDYDERAKSVCFVGQAGLREYPATGWGDAVPLFDGNLVDLWDGRALLLDPAGETLRVIYDSSEATR